MRGHTSLLQIYNMLNGHFGNLQWWPGESPFEVIVGAILTQNTTWRNVETAIANLKSKNLLDPKRLFKTRDDILASLIRPSGYYRVKTKRLKAFLTFLNDGYQDSLDRLFAEELWILREKLLTVRGIGEETADSILLYAGQKPIFVVDAYTRRILQRHDFISSETPYADIQSLFMTNLPLSVPLFNQYHALLVNTGKQFCTKKYSRCTECPLSTIVDHALLSALHKP
jgi:endonuclease-3 related protein